MRNLEKITAIIYLKLLLLSLKDSGKLYYDGVETASTRCSGKSRGQKALQCNTGATSCNLSSLVRARQRETKGGQ